TVAAISCAIEGSGLKVCTARSRSLATRTKIIMSDHPTESKRLLSHTIAEWACSLNYEDLSPEAIQAAKLFWFDSIGCALGGSQQDDAKILLKHYRTMSG